MWLYVQGATSGGELGPTYATVLVADSGADMGTRAEDVRARPIEVRADDASGLVRSLADVAGRVL